MHRPRRRPPVYAGCVAPRSRSFSARVRDQLAFSVVAVLILFFLLKLVGIRSTFAGLFLSVVVTILLNVGLTYLGDARARHARRTDRPARPARPSDGDIRWREEERRR